ncbi:TonB family protein [Hyphomicrobium sp.]|uniref:TonB family protein n=1 Tax=Hyphomicrobium sp. TaxID=82 RepID=UPI002CEC8669|nr:TonB family protein [Hyphomicrobium sp.]HVZ05015.1 TonB family protein [Hyphomicrobium sp.]
MTPVEFSDSRAPAWIAREANARLGKKDLRGAGATIVSLPRLREPRPTSPIIVATAEPRAPSRFIFICAMIVSIGLHAATIFGIWGPRGDAEQFGTMADDKDVVSLSTVQTLVLESIQTDSSDTASSSAVASQAGSIQSVESTPQELSEVQDEPVSDQPPPKPVKVAEVTPTALAEAEDPLPVIRGGGAPDALSEVKADQIAEKVVEDMPLELETKEYEPEKAKQEHEKDKKRQTAQKQSHAQAAGGTTSRAIAAQTPSNGRVTASRGNVLTYMASLRAQIARHKISVFGAKGKAIVSFAIAEDGALKFVRLAKSSKNASVDKAALSTIRRAAPFLPPPPELPPTQTYSIPFYAN